MSDIPTCSVKGCKEISSMGYYNKHICNKHWAILAEKSSDEIKDILEIKRKKIEEPNIEK
jgi:hypothetical protein